MELDPAEFSPVAKLLEDYVQEHRDTPLLRLLDSVPSLDGAQGEPPLTPSKQPSPARIARCVAMTAYLSLNPGKTAEGFTKAF